ncbi:hypothetical protein ALO96_03902, partial [Pseudomonas savastanoi pv. glycinea]
VIRPRLPTQLQSISAKTGSCLSMTAHAVIHHAPNDQVVTFQNMPSWICGIFRLELDDSIDHEEPFADRLRVIQRCNDYLPMLRVAATVDDDQIPIEMPAPIMLSPKIFARYT